MRREVRPTYLVTRHPYTRIHNLAQRLCVHVGHAHMADEATRLQVGQGQGHVLHAGDAVVPPTGEGGGAGGRRGGGGNSKK